MTILDIIKEYYIVISVVLAVVLGFILFFVLRYKLFYKKLISILQSPGLLKTDYHNYFTEKKVLSYSNIIEKTANKINIKLLSITGLDELWLTRLKKHKNKTNFDKVLKYYPENGLFTCFLLSLERKKLALRLLKWLSVSEDFLIMRKIALSGVGEEFSGEKALEIFKENLPQIREMIGDPEWASRYFAIKILLYDDNDQSIRAIWDSFRDSHPLVRKTIASEFIIEDRDRLYKELYRLFLNDPVLEVRIDAKERINKDFKDLYKIDIDKLTISEALHALEHLSSFSKADEDTALKFLDNDNLELRFAAARFLEEQGSLNRLLDNADLGDRDELNRVQRLLEKSSRVHITSFLESVTKSSNRGAIYIAINILSEVGDVSLIDKICKNALQLPQDCIENIELFDKALDCINKRGTEGSLVNLIGLLDNNRNNKEYAVKILKSLPKRGASLFIGTLLNLLCDDTFKARDELRRIIIKLPSDLYIQKLLNIIKAGRGSYSHVIRKDALKILIELEHSFCLQTILENLPILPLEDAREFAKLLIKYNEDEFDVLTEIIFNSDDAAVRSSLISCLPAINKRDYIKNIKEALSDADPEVRISSIWALVDFKEKRTVNQAISMLRDPIDRVRKEVAKAIAETGSDTALSDLENIILDDNEVSSVKVSAITGLGLSESIKAIDILINVFIKDNMFDQEVTYALLNKTSKKEVNKLIEWFKDATPDLRDKLTNVFILMKEDGEATIMELLYEDISTLKEAITQILEKTGYIEKLIRFLKHRDPQKRRSAASKLAFIGTQSAFRGIVLAARDSDEEVRVCVTKALEKLNNSESEMILKSLKEDPDKKVRKYTSWALERINARKLDD